MAPNARARKNHDELFPGHASTISRPAREERRNSGGFDEGG